MDEKTAFPAAAAAGLVLLFTAPARGAENPLIEEGIQQYNDLMYEESVETLSAALMRSGNTDEQLVQIYKYLGLDYLLLEKPDEAEGAFRQLLAIDEDWSFDPVTTSPKIVTFFNKVKQKWIAEGKPGKVGAEAEPGVEIRHKVPDQGIRGEPIHLKFVVEDPQGELAALFVYYKTEQGFLAVKATPESPPAEETVYMATLPGDVVTPPHVDYYVQAQDIGGDVLAGRGDVDAPLRVTVPAKEGGSVAKKWWFWTIIGVAVAGVAGGVAGGVIAAQKKDGGGPDPAHVSISICEHGLDCP
jgi:hypothetical protein